MEIGRKGTCKRRVINLQLNNESHRGVFRFRKETMRMMKKFYTRKCLCMGRKALLLVVLAGMLAGTAACSGKETVLLESEDLVRMEGGEFLSESFSAGEDLTKEEAETLERVEESTLFIHICGAVERPGVYELPVGSRIYEAVEEAGGFTQEAADDYLNLAYRLEDGWKVEIPERKSLGLESEEAEKEKGGEEAEYKAAIISGIAPDTSFQTGAMKGTETETTGETDDGLVDINTASKEELLTLPGVGESRAQSIISYREKNGGFSRIEDIMRVEGIKEGMFAKMKDKICVRGVR